jgi:hypothetical protein
MIKNGLAFIGGAVIVIAIARTYARYIEGKYARMYAGQKPAAE